MCIRDSCRIYRGNSIPQLGIESFYGILYACIVRFWSDFTSNSSGHIWHWLLSLRAVLVKFEFCCLKLMAPYRVCIPLGQPINWLVLLDSCYFLLPQSIYLCLSTESYRSKPLGNRLSPSKHIAARLQACVISFPAHCVGVTNMSPMVLYPYATHVGSGAVRIGPTPFRDRR